MKAALIFGGSGFIGSHLIEELLNQGYEVWNYDLEGFDIDHKYYFEIRDSILHEHKKLMNDIYQIQPDVVFNFAALANIEDCNQDPFDAFDINICGNQNILEGIIANKVKKYVYASSLYARSDKSGAYGLTKKHSEDWVKYYAKKYGFSYIILRFGTVFGSRAPEENSIQKIIKQALKTKVISYYGSGKEVRNYISVEDAARFTREIISEEKYWNKTINLMGHQYIKSADLLELLKDILGNDYKIQFRNEPHEDHYVISPYSYDKDSVINYVSDYSDLGLGLLRVIKDLDK